MARLKFGPWGGIIGRLGHTIGYFRKGKPILRMISMPPTKKRTVKQKTTTQRFGLIIKFMPAVNDFTNVGFEVAAQGTTKTAQNLAVSYNTKHAIKGEYPNQEIDYTKIMLSSGKLDLAHNISITVNKEIYTATLTYRWDIDPSWTPKMQRDQVMMLAYAPEVNKAFFIDSGARRSAGEDTLDLAIKFGSAADLQVVTYVETYIGFISNDRKSISDSLYTGRIEIG